MGQVAFYLLGVFLVFAGTYLQGVHVSSFVQPTAFVLVAGISVGIVLLSFPLKMIVPLVLAPFRQGSSEQIKRDAEKFYVSLGNTTVTAGLLGAGIGAVYFIRCLGDTSMLGGPLALSIVSLFYGYMIYLFVTLPIIARLKTSGSKERPNYGQFFAGGSIVLAAMLLGIKLEGDRWNIFLAVPNILFILSGLLAVVAGAPTRFQNLVDIFCPAALAGGMVGTLVGLVHVFQNLSDAETLYRGLAVALAAPFFGFVTYLLIRTTPGAKRRLATRTLLLPQTACALILLASFVGLTMAALKSDGHVKHAAYTEQLSKPAICTEESQKLNGHVPKFCMEY